MADQQRRLGAGGGEGEADAGGGLDDAGAELQQPQPERGEFRGRQGVRLGDGVFPGRRITATGRPVTTS